MLKEESMFHCHDKLDRLVEALQDHLLILGSPLLEKAADRRVIVEDLASCLQLLDVELRGHVEVEEREMYPVLKRHLAVKHSPEMEQLYVEHRMIEAAINRLGFELSRALRSLEICRFCEHIMVLAGEVVDLFMDHSVNECQIFRWAGLGHVY